MPLRTEEETAGASMSQDLTIQEQRSYVEEEIRELGEEVEQMADHAHMALQRVCDLIDDGDDGEGLVAYVRDVCEYTRTWVRLAAILEERKKGMKP